MPKKKKQNVLKRFGYVDNLRRRKKRPRVLETISMKMHSGLNIMTSVPYVVERKREQNNNDYNLSKKDNRFNDLLNSQARLQTQLYSHVDKTEERFKSILDGLEQQQSGRIDFMPSGVLTKEGKPKYFPPRQPTSAQRVGKALKHYHHKHQKGF